MRCTQCLHPTGPFPPFKRADFSPEVRQLKSHLHKGIWTELMLLWHIFSKVRKHKHFHIQVVYHSDKNEKRGSQRKCLTSKPK